MTSQVLQWFLLWGAQKWTGTSTCNQTSKEISFFTLLICCLDRTDITLSSLLRWQKFLDTVVKQAARKAVGATLTIRSACLYRSSSEQNWGEELSGKVCGIVDAPKSFKFDMWNHFGLLVSRKEKGEKGDGREKKQYANTANKSFLHSEILISLHTLR